jgi:hypothetical protein
VPELGIEAIGVHLPTHRLDGKRAREAGRADGFEALRVPAWDEDGLTMAIEAALARPDEALAGVERVRLFTGEPVEQAGLAATALDLDVPVTTSQAPAGLVAELASHEGGEELWLAAGRELGGAGVALRVGDEGLPIDAHATATAAPLDPDPASALAQAFDELDPEAEIARLVGPRHASLATDDPFGLQVGEAGPAAPGLEIAHQAAQVGEAALVGAFGGGQAHAVRLAGSCPVHGLDQASVELEPDRLERRQDADPPAWSEASQGAYVSREVYDSDPERRYGARARSHGEVAAVTTIRGGPPGEFARQHEADGSYDVVIVDLDEGDREIGQAAVPAGELAIGDRVEPVLRFVFSIEDQRRYGLKWRPAD